MYNFAIRICLNIIAETYLNQITVTGFEKARQMRI